MTKRTISRTFSVPNTDDQAIINRGFADQISQLTSDVSDMLDGGITFDNISGSLVDIDITSGVAFSLPKIKKGNPIGAAIINTFGNTVSEYSITNSQDGSLILTVTCTPQRSKLKVVIYGK